MMALYEKIYDVIVVGAGHAGCGMDDGKSDASDHLPVMTVFRLNTL
jgi:tRNA U34 5-carboxymethylaminomethyl modifying enzyme MnmG/GidA